MHILASLLTISAAAHAQRTGAIRGTVRDKDFGAPVGGAQVLIVETAQRVLSTESGSYVLNDVPAGRYTLVFSKAGYIRQVRSDVVVEEGRLVEIEVDLVGEVTEMEEVVVEDLLRGGGSTESDLLQLRFQTRSLLDSVGAEQMSRAGASDAAAALRLVAGATLQDGKSAVIRGLPDRYVSTQLNGVRLPSADEDKRAVELDQFPAAVVESVQVTKTFTPDQQGDASGGAVDVRLKSIPDEPFFFRVSGQTSYNTQTTGRGDFLTYDGGGVNFLGKDDGRRRVQTENLGGNWTGAVGVENGEAPFDEKLSMSIGGQHEFESGLKIGGMISLFHEQDSESFKGGKDDSYWVETPGGPMVPKKSQQTAAEDYKTALYDVAQSSQSVQWGDLITVGAEYEGHSIGLTHLYTHSAEDKATLAEDTRGKQHFFPGHDPNDPNTPGHAEADAAPYLRLETLEYTERTTESWQVHGHHEVPIGRGDKRKLELDWYYAHSTAHLFQPDKRQFGSQWRPARQIGPFTIPAFHQGYKPDANFTLGNLQRIWKDIEETSDQYGADLKIPFAQWSGDEGFLKFGLFDDRVRREFDQDSYSNFNDNSTFDGPWEQHWSSVFPFESHPITDSTYDVDYSGRQRIEAAYAMLELPLIEELRLIGGARYEVTHIDIVNDPEADATWFPPGSLAPTALNPGDADVAFAQDDLLPSVGLICKPGGNVTLRAFWSRTVARQTFKELTPILQQEYLGGPIFIGNPDLGMASLDNYDLRADWTPYEGGLLSVSWFHKDIDDPIEYVQKVATFDYTTAVNYPSGKLRGWEVEVRHDLGTTLAALSGVGVGGNATWIDSEVQLPADEQLGFSLPNIAAPMSSRDMTNAPEHLYNAYLTWDIKRWGTQLGMFYTVTGDMLVAGAGQSGGNFVPSVYAAQFDTLNFSLTQNLGGGVKLRFQAKNLTDPGIQEVYRSSYIGDDVVKTSYTKGIEFTIGLGGEFRF